MKFYFNCIYFLRSSVRKSAVLTLAHCLQLADSESSYQMAFPKLEKSLSDPELEVVSVVIPTIHKVINVNISFCIHYSEIDFVRLDIISVISKQLYILFT